MLYPAKISFKNEGKIKTISLEGKLKECVDRRHILSMAIGCPTNKNDLKRTSGRWKKTVSEKYGEIC